MTDYGYTVEVAEGYDEAVIRTRLALRGQGFSILTEMHVGGMLGPDAGDDRQYLIMAVWNSMVGSRDLGADLRVAVHLPCNVVVQETQGGALVAALDPADAVDGSTEATAETLEDARGAIGRALQTVASPL